MTRTLVAAIFLLLAVVHGQQAPEKFQATFHTTVGDITFNVTRKYSPLGVDRFYQLVLDNYFGTNADNANGFFRVVPNFVVQFGLSGDPKITAKWNHAIRDDPVLLSNKKGTMTFATSGPNTRTTQLFINHKDNGFLDSQGFSAFAEVADDASFANVLKIYSGHGERPNQSQIYAQGNAYLRKNFPNLDYINSASVTEL